MATTATKKSTAKKPAAKKPAANKTAVNKAAPAEKAKQNDGPGLDVRSTKIEIDMKDVGVRTIENPRGETVQVMLRRDGLGYVGKTLDEAWKNMTEAVNGK